MRSEPATASIRQNQAGEQSSIYSSGVSFRVEAKINHSSRPKPLCQIASHTSTPISQLRSIGPFLAAQLSNAVRAAQAFQHEADLIFGRIMPASGSANIPDRLFSAVRHALARLSHRCSWTDYEEPEFPSYAVSLFCPTVADGLHRRPIRSMARFVSNTWRSTLYRSALLNNSRACTTELQPETFSRGLWAFLIFPMVLSHNIRTFSFVRAIWLQFEIL